MTTGQMKSDSGQGMALRHHLPHNPFEQAFISFTENGENANSFQVHGLEEASRHIYEREIEALRQHIPFTPWWLQ